jgi:hypothetical protein
MARRIGVWVSGAALALTSSGGFANTQIIEGATFDVASVKPNRSGETRISVNTEAGRFVAINAPLILLIRLAYVVPEYRIVNTPDWVRSERFDIVATPGGPVSASGRMPCCERCYGSDSGSSPASRHAKSPSTRSFEPDQTILSTRSSAPLPLTASRC